MCIAYLLCNPLEIAVRGIPYKRSPTLPHCRADERLWGPHLPGVVTPIDSGLDGDPPTELIATGHHPELSAATPAIHCDLLSRYRATYPLLLGGEYVNKGTTSLVHSLYTTYSSLT
jgi:hypothetical protein